MLRCFHRNALPQDEMIRRIRRCDLTAGNESLGLGFEVSKVHGRLSVSLHSLSVSLSLLSEQDEALTYFSTILTACCHENKPSLWNCEWAPNSIIFLISVAWVMVSFLSNRTVTKRAGIRKYQPMKWVRVMQYQQMEWWEVMMKWVRTMQYYIPRNGIRNVVSSLGMGKLSAPFCFTGHCILKTVWNIES